MSFELLIGLGLLLLLLAGLAVRFWSKRRAPSLSDELTTFERESSLSEPPSEEEAPQEEEPGREPLPEVVQIVVALKEGRIEGAQLSELFHTLGLRRNSDGLFYWREEEFWFGVASADARGTFPKELTSFKTRGLVFFCQPQKLKDPKKAFEIMRQKAAQARTALGGLWLDETLQPLTEERLSVIEKKLGDSDGRS